mgnify:CR=1 FL=1
MSDILLLGAGRGGYSAGGGGGGGGGEVTYTVSASADDGSFSRNNTSNTFPSTFTSISTNATTARSYKDVDDDGGQFDYKKAYFRFQNINIAQGTTIQSAFFKPIFKRGVRGSVTMDIVGTDVDNVSAPSSASDGNSSLHTSAVVEWTNVDLPSGGTGANDTTRRTSPDIKTIIQEIVDRSGWSAGNAIMIQTFFDINIIFGTVYRDTRTYDDTSGGSAGDYAAQLVITT